MTERTPDDERTDLPTMQSFRQSVASRRQVLAGTGTVLGAGMLGSSGALAAEHESGGEGMEIPDQFDQPDTDADMLQYALTPERLEDEFYQMGLEQFSPEEIAGATVLEGNEEVLEQVPAYLQMVSEHETAHTEQLTRVLEVLGATPAEPPEFQFNIESPDQFIATAQVLENTGVGAYAGAAPRIESPDILSAALSIHSVEARHAGLLNYLNGESPFPNAFDPALAIPEVLNAIQPFIAGGMDEEDDEDGNDMPDNGTDVPDNGTEMPTNESDH